MAGGREYEAVAVRAACVPVDGLALSPPMTGMRGTRPQLVRVDGPRLDALLRAQGRPGGSGGTRAAGAPATAPGQSTDARAGGDLLARTGRLLAGLHARAVPVARATPDPAYPWTPLSLENWLGLSPSQRILVGELRDRPGTRANAERLSAELSTGGTWLHGDARADNVCVTATGDPVLIDWELTGTGRAERDVGTMCGSVIACVLAVALVSNTSAARARGELRQAMGQAGRWIASLLRGYEDVRPTALDSELLAAAVGLTLVSVGWATCVYQPLDRRNRAMVDLGTSLLDRPSRWRAIHAR